MVEQFGVMEDKSRKNVANHCIIKEKANIKLTNEVHII